MQIVASILLGRRKKDFTACLGVFFFFSLLSKILIIKVKIDQYETIKAKN